MARRLDRFDDDLLRQVHHGFVIGIRPIEFDHRELWIMFWTNPFVSIDPSHFIHPLDTAHQQSLEVQFERDSQEQFHVERVVVCNERAGGRTTCDRVQCRALDFDELMFGQRRSDRVNDLRPIQKRMQ